jgi:hypothetical protein
MRYFLAVYLLALASASAQESGARSTTAANTEPEVRRATAANPAYPDEPEVRRATAVDPASPIEPEVRRAVPVEPPSTSEIPVRRAVAVSPAATPAVANSAASDTQAHLLQLRKNGRS